MAPRIHAIPKSQTLEYRLEAIPIALNRHGIMFSKTTAAKLVGGRGKLQELIEQGKIGFNKRSAGKQNGKWFCNAGDVIRNLKI